VRDIARARARGSRESARARNSRVSLAALANGRLFKYSELSAREPFVPALGHKFYFLIKRARKRVPGSSRRFKYSLYIRHLSRAG